jgi:hypothetical protein
MIALALQNRLREALETERTRGVAAFEAAAECLRGARSGQDFSSAQKVEIVWNALRRALLVASWLLGITFVFLAGLMSAEFRRRKQRTPGTGATRGAHRRLGMGPGIRHGDLFTPAVRPARRWHGRKTSDCKTAPGCRASR